MPLVLFAGLAIASALLLRFKPQAAEPGAPGESAATADGWTPAGPEGESVSLAIDFGNGASREFSLIPWREGMTLGDVMQAAADHRPGIRLTKQGQGAMTLLTSIDGVANQGPGGRSWIYRVNEQPGEVSFAVQPIRAGDRVLWVFSPPE